MKQLLIVITPEWNAVQGQMLLFESAWVKSFPIVVGKNGMAWGIGKHSKQPGLQKSEGDEKSPAGIFALGPAFGKPHPTKMDYFPITSDMEAVDDPCSQFYNQIVKRSEVAHPDWNSSERMADIDLYDLGLVIQHNFPKPRSGAGSAIFMHIWASEQMGTGGCTAMAREDLAWLLAWLDKAKNPHLVQLPIKEYRELQQPWKLPSLERFNRFAEAV